MRRVAVVGALQRLDGQPRRHLAADVPTHAVGHREERVAGRSPVLVAGPGPGRCRWPRRSAARSPADLEDRRADLEQVALGQPGRLGDPLGVDEGPVGRAEVLHPDLAAAAVQAGVHGRAVGVVGGRDPASVRNARRSPRRRGRRSVPPARAARSPRGGAGDGPSRRAAAAVPPPRPAAGPGAARGSGPAGRTSTNTARTTRRKNRKMSATTSHWSGRMIAVVVGP